MDSVSLLLLLVVTCFCLSLTSVITESFSDEMIDPRIEVKDSHFLKGKGRGLFATKDYEAGDTIEVCPTLGMTRDGISKDNIINEHLFAGNKDNNFLLSLGYCSIINHSKENQNCFWQVADDDTNIKMIALTDIKKGEEFFSNYGDGYWSNRKDEL
jgi:uncharacterized protein